MHRGDLTNAQFERLKPVLPPQGTTKKGGRPPAEHRQIINGILWVLRTGSPWRDLPERYGNWKTVASRFYRWQRAGIWQRLLEALQQQAYERGELDWEEHYVDSTVVRAHQHAAGAKSRGTADEGLGRSRGGFSTKVHFRADGRGRPMTFVVTPGQRHDAVAFEQLLDQGKVRRATAGRPKQRPKRIVGDKAYSSAKNRRLLRQRGIRAVIPTPSCQRRLRTFDREAYRRRNHVERLVNRLKQHRRVATRYEKRAHNYLAMLNIAAVLLWL